MGDSDVKVCLVTGGSRGLGAGIVLDQLSRGNVVATFSRARSEFVTECATKYPDRFVWEAIDVSDRARVRDFAIALSRKHGRLDALVNNAAVAADGVFTLMRDSDIDRSIAVNLSATINLTKACVKIMLQHGGGVVLNISSVNAIRGNSGVAVYTATKAAIDGMTRSLARELGPRGIRINSLAPGYFESEMVSDMSDVELSKIRRRTPLGRLASVADLVGPIRFLLSDDAKFVTGQTLVVDGGLTC